MNEVGTKSDRKRKTETEREKEKETETDRGFNWVAQF